MAPAKKPGPWDVVSTAPAQQSAGDGWNVVSTAPDSSSVAGAGPLGVPQLPDHPAVNMQPRSSGQVAYSVGKDLGIGALKGAGSTANNIGHLAVPDWVLNAAGAQGPSKEQQESYFAPKNTTQAVGKGAEQIGEFLVPGLGEEAATAKLGKFAPLGRMAYQAATTGAVNKAQGGDFSTGAASGLFGGAIGEGIRAAAPALAESALKVGGADRMYGRTVGRAILDDTKGIYPETVEQSARDTVNNLIPQLEQAAADAGQNGSRASLTPARQGVAGRVAGHIQNRAVKSAKELEPLQGFLDRDAVTGLPLSSQQTPTGTLQLKRGLDADFIGNWNPTRNSNNELDAAKQAYRNVADEFHASAPGTKDMDQRISSLIPVMNRANRTSLGAGVLENTLNRFRTPTGALVSSVGLGGAEYNRSHSLPQALGAAAFGAVAPSLIASPVTQMAGARLFNNAVPRYVTPAISGAGLNLFGRSEKDKKKDSGK